MTVYIPGGRGTPASSRAEGAGAGSSRAAGLSREVGGPLHARAPMPGTRTQLRVAAPRSSPAAPSSGEAWAVSRQGGDVRRVCGETRERRLGGDGVPGACQRCFKGALTWIGEEEPRGSGIVVSFLRGSPVGTSGGCYCREGELGCFEPTRVRRIDSSDEDGGSQWGMWLAQDPLATYPLRLILIAREVQISGFPLSWSVRTMSPEGREHTYALEDL